MMLPYDTTKLISQQGQSGWVVNRIGVKSDGILSNKNTGYATAKEEQAPETNPVDWRIDADHTCPTTARPLLQGPIT